ncbi:hypothetical protein L1887_09321 [Cichorium endivia]|nr:hypothetical protein L1887_09321 [Cichorium endivia]
MSIRIPINTSGSPLRIQSSENKKPFQFFLCGSFSLCRPHHLVLLSRPDRLAISGDSFIQFGDPHSPSDHPQSASHRPRR